MTIRFNNVEITADEVNDYLRQQLKLKQVCNEILHQKIIAEATDARKIEITEAEIETEANKIRSALRLEKAADTLAWLEDNLINPVEWSNGIRNDLLRKKLAKKLFDSQVEAYFAENRLNFDQFVLYHLVVPYEKLAQELFYQIEEEEISFYQAAHLYDIDSKRRYLCGYEGEVHRWDYEPDIAAAIFKTPIVIGELIEPIKSKEGCHLFKIEDYFPAQLTPKIRQDIIDNLFKQWLNSELNYFIHSDKVPDETMTPVK